MMPTSMIAAISSEVATGRRIKGRDGFIAGDSLVAPLASLSLSLSLALASLAPARLAIRGSRRGGAVRRRRAAAGDVYLGPLLEPVGAVDNDDLPGRQSLGDRDLLV